MKSETSLTVCTSLLLGSGLPHQCSTSEQSHNTNHTAGCGDVPTLETRAAVSLVREGLYGIQEAKSELDSGDHWRVPLGMVYSLFD